MAIDRKGYNFSTDQKYERKEGSSDCCERCGKSSKNLTAHHLIPIFLAIRNPVLTKLLIKDIINLQMLCYDCHVEADDEQKRWKRDDIGHIAWALFDLDQEVVAKAQGTVKAKRKKKGKRKKKTKGRKKRAR